MAAGCPSSTDGARRMRMAKLGGSVSPSGESRRVRTRIQFVLERYWAT